MICHTRRVMLAVSLVSAIALGVLGVPSSAVGDEPAETRLTFEGASPNDIGVTISVRLTTPAGEPVAHQPVDFFVTPDFLGERPMPLPTTLTDAAGNAQLTYVPTWEGPHNLTARFNGDEAYQATESSATLTVSGLPVPDTSEPASLGPVRQWAVPGAVLVAFFVWLTLASILIRVAWGIRQAGRAEGRTALLPRTVTEGLRSQ